MQKQERGLVPLEAEKDAITVNLTPRQQSIVQQEATRYLKTHNIPFNNANFKGAWAVLGIDALQTGLLLSNRTGLQAENSPRPFIKKGLEYRGYVARVADEVLDLTRKSQVPAEGEFLGPFALERTLLDPARHELNLFLLTSQIANVNRLTREYLERREALLKIAEFAIDALPKEQYPEASLEQFPDPEEQAKIVRNMIASLIFRQTVLPAISVEELQDFSRQNKEAVQQRFATDFPSEFWQTLYERTGIAKFQAQKLITGLKKQTEMAFLRTAEPDQIFRTEREILDVRDRFYRIFSPVLLLLHPALEEKRFITRPEMGSSDTYSLWRSDLSTVVSEWRVPNSEALHRGLRWARATRSAWEEKRFRDGLSAWRRLTVENKSEEEQKYSLKAKKEDLEQRIVFYEENPDRPLPEIAYRIFNDQFFSATRISLREAQRIIASVLTRKSEAEDYLQELLKLHDGVLPLSAPPPRSESLLITNREIANSRRRTSMLNGLSDRYIGQLSDDFWVKWAEKLGLVNINLEGRELDEKGLASLASELESVKDNITSGKVSITLKGSELGGFIVSLDQTIANRRSDLYAKNISNEERNYLLSLIRLRESLARASINNLNRLRNTLRSNFLLGLDAARRKVNTVRSNIRKRQEAEASLDTLHAYRDKLVNSSEELPSKTGWSKREIEDYFREAQAAVLPDAIINSIDSARTRSFVKKMDDFFKADSTKGFPWPVEMPNRKGMAKWIERFIIRRESEEENLRIELENKIPDRSLRVRLQHRLRRYGKQIKQAKTLWEGIDNPLFPFEEGEGLPPNKFWLACRRRFIFVLSLISLPGLQSRAEIAQEGFEKLVRKDYLNRLGVQLNNLEEDLRKLEEEKPAQSNFLRKMQELNLLIPAETG